MSPQIQVIPPVKCSVCSSSKVVAVQSNKKIVGRFCESCRFYNDFKKGLMKVFKVNVTHSMTDYLHKNDLTFMTLKKGNK
jgi:hypothetical protein